MNVDHEGDKTCRPLQVLNGRSFCKGILKRSTYLGTYYVSIPLFIANYLQKEIHIVRLDEIEFLVGKRFIKSKNMYRKGFTCKIHTSSNLKRELHAISSYKDHLYKDQVLNPPEFKDHQY